MKKSKKLFNVKTGNNEVLNFNCHSVLAVDVKDVMQKIETVLQENEYVLEIKMIGEVDIE